MPIFYVKGDATRPLGEGNKIIVHICNDIGAWGAGFVMAISRRWIEPEAQYRRWATLEKPLKLGHVQLVQVEPDVWVANMIGQHGISYRNNVSPIRYEAVLSAIRKVAKEARAMGASIHMPRIGCGLAGGSWDVVGKIVERELGGFNVTVYDL